MNKLNKLAVTVAACGLVLSSNVRALDLVGVNDDRAVEVSSAPQTPSSTPSASELLRKNPNRKLTVSQFLDYVKEVQALNPQATAQQIITQFHHGQYAKDEGVYIPLFAEGEENSGWQGVKLPAGTMPPKFITDKDGNLVDIAHSYAGVRGGLNRSGIHRWAMKNVNTNWGDSLQIVNSYILSARSYLSGDFDNGKKHFSRAPSYKPEDQIRGNNLGIQLESHLRDNPQTKLSQAYETCLAGSTKGSDLHDDVLYAAAVSPLGAVIKRTNASGSIVKAFTGKQEVTSPSNERSNQILRNIGSSAIRGTFTTPLIQRSVLSGR